MRLQFSEEYGPRHFQCLPPLIQGNLNGDGVIDILDIIALVNMILNGGYSIIADLNEDGVINILDIIIYKNTIQDN